MTNDSSALGHRTGGRNAVDESAEAQSNRALFAPSYQNKLRAIGRHLDLCNMRWMNLLEVNGGILVRAVERGTSHSELMEFPDDAFPGLIEEAVLARGNGDHEFVKATLTPTGYEDVLRAIGFQLDRRAAKWISIIESRSVMFVTGMEYQESSTGSGYSQFEFGLSPDHVQAVLDAAFRRRAGVASIPNGDR